MKKTLKEIVSEPITPETGCLFSVICMLLLIAVIAVALFFRM